MKNVEVKVNLQTFLTSNNSLYQEIHFLQNMPIHLKITKHFFTIKLILFSHTS